MNLKLETEKEKIMPFYKDSVKPENSENNDDDLESKLQPYNTTILTSEGQRINEWNYLENFFKRFNKVRNNR